MQLQFIWMANIMTEATLSPSINNPPLKNHKPVLFYFTLLIGITVVLYAGYWWYFGRDQIATENAYVEGHIIQITAQTSGTVTEVLGDNTDVFSSGQTLVKLNPVDARLALEQAKANLAKTVRQVRGQFSSASQMKAAIKIKKSELSLVLADLNRRKPLLKTAAISVEEFKHAEESVKAAKAALRLAEEQFAINQALVDRMPLRKHPEVIVASSRLHDAYVGLSRTELKAPLTGVITKRHVQIGQRVSPSNTLMSLVDLNNLWVTANLKESQLKNIRIGQSVTLSTDVYGNEVTYTGRVVGIDAGTGSAFALLPAQNATGNWIKVVQRVPVRIGLVPTELQRHPLRIGLSMSVVIDTSNRSGRPLQLAQMVQRQGTKTNIFLAEEIGADSLIEAIIKENESQGGRQSERTFL